MSECPHWLEYIRALGPALIALFVAFVAYQQWRTNYDGLREKLFDRRIEVHNQVYSALARLLREGFPAQGIENELTDAWRSSKFLFDDDIPDYIDTLREAVNDGQFYFSQAHQSEEKRSDYFDKEHERFQWLSKQFDPMHQIFSKYLKFNTRRD
ncbi:hypothetical protein OO012_07360 [Rhodobacteraceae bacterium KMM 6894]|nr:hypothetical protein [Rhodobacteraceae bacterium KMM 6894]